MSKSQKPSRIHSQINRDLSSTLNNELSDNGSIRPMKNKKIDLAIMLDMSEEDQSKILAQL